MIIPQYIFFISLFIVIGSVEKSGLLAIVGEQFNPMILENAMMAALVLLWEAAILAALIDNLPFTAAMLHLLAVLQAEGVNVSVM